MSIAVWIGSTSFVLAIIGLIAVIVRKIINPAAAVFGWASLVSIILLIGGLQLLCIGIIGRYIGKIFLQVKNRPIYIIQEKNKTGSNTSPSYFYGSPGSRTQILRTGILRAIHYTKDP